MNMSGGHSSQINPASLILVTRPTFLGVVWTCVTLSLFLVSFRIWVRLRVFHKLFDDDIFVIVAWLILFTCTVLWHVRNTLDLMYESYYVGYGAVLPSKYLQEHMTNWLHILFAELLLNLLGLWCIKFAFLALLRRLGHNVKGQKIVWWVVFALTTAGLAISIGVCYFPCIFATYEFEITFCPKPEAGAAIKRSYRIQIGLDFSTDFLIMLIPIQLLWNVQMSLKQKVGLLVLFALMLVTMVFSILRVEVSLRGIREDDVFFFLCATIELTIAITIACIVSYRSFFAKRSKARASNKPAGASPLFNNDGVYHHTEVSGANYAYRLGRKSSSIVHGGDGAEIMPLDMINVKTEVAIHSHAPKPDRDEGRGYVSV